MSDRLDKGRLSDPAIVIKTNIIIRTITNKVEIIYQTKGVLMHNIYVYSKSVAIDFIEECRKNQIEIPGIDAFIIAGDYHQPSLDNSIDLDTSNGNDNNFNKSN